MMMEKTQQVFQVHFKQIKAKVQKDRTDFCLWKVQRTEKTLLSEMAGFQTSPDPNPRFWMVCLWGVQCPISSEHAEF